MSSAPGSVAQSKHSKAWKPYTLVEDRRSAVLNAVWVKLLTKSQRRTQAATAAPSAGKVPKGQHDNGLFRLLAKMQREGKSEEEMRAAWLAEVATYDVNPRDPFTEADFQRHLRSVAKYPPLGENDVVERMAREWWWDICDEKMVRELSQEPVHYTLGKLEKQHHRARGPAPHAEGLRRR